MRFLLTTSPLLLIVLLVMDTNEIHIRSAGERIPKMLDNEMNVEYATKMTTKGEFKTNVMDKDEDKSTVDQPTILIDSRTNEEANERKATTELKWMQQIQGVYAMATLMSLDAVSSAVERNFKILIATTTMVSLVLLYSFAMLSSSIIKRCQERRKIHDKEMK